MLEELEAAVTEELNQIGPEVYWIFTIISSSFPQLNSLFWC